MARVSDRISFLEQYLIDSHWRFKKKKKTHSIMNCHISLFIFLFIFLACSALFLPALTNLSPTFYLLTLNMIKKFYGSSDNNGKLQGVKCNIEKEKIRVELLYFLGSIILDP